VVPEGSRNGAGAVSAVVRARDVAATPPEFVRRTLFLEKETEQYHVCLGAPGIARDDERRFALRVLEGVLGGTSSSRLFQEVRERRGLAYSVFTFSNLFAGSGEVGIYVGTRPDNVGRAFEVVADELARIRENPVADDELVRSRENLKGRMALGLESTGSRMTRLGASLLADLPLLSVDELIARIDAVGLDDVRDLAHELFDPSRISFAGVGPDERRFHEAIEPFQLAAVAADGSGG
jgi:predicted Zn-dependent peptidase